MDPGNRRRQRRNARWHRDLIRPLAALLALSTLFPAQAADEPIELLVCAPGYPGTTKQAQAVMDTLVSQLAARAGWPAGRLRARYIARESDGISAIGRRPALLLTTTEFYAKHAKLIGGEIVAATRLASGTEERFTVMVPRDGKRDDAAAGLKGRTLYGTRLLDVTFASRVATRNQLDLAKLSDVQRQKRTLRAVKKATAAPATSALWLSSAECHLLEQPAQKERLAGWVTLFRTEPIPSAPVLALGKTPGAPADPALVKTIQAALMNLASTDEGKALCTRMRIRGFAKPDNARYAAVVKAYHAAPDDDDAKDR